MKNLFLKSFCIVFLWVGCNSRQNNYSEKQQNRKSSDDSIAKIDSLKWIYYSINYYGKALFYDTMAKKKLEINPLECEIKLENFQKLENDSLLYSFTLLKPNYTFLYVKGLAYASDFIVSGNNICPLFGDLNLDFQKNLDSTKAYLNKSDSMFKIYLKKYSGEISPWLRKEATRRKII